MGRHGEVLSNAPFSEKGDELVLKTRELLILMSGLGKLLLVNAFQAQNCLFKRRVRKGSSGPGLCADMRWGQLKLCGVVGTNTTKGRELTKVEGRRTRAGKSNLARANEGGGTEDGLDMRGSKEMEAFGTEEAVRKLCVPSARANGGGGTEDGSWQRDGGSLRELMEAEGQRMGAGKGTEEAVRKLCVPSARANGGGGTEDGSWQRDGGSCEEAMHPYAGANTSWRDGGVMRDVSSAGANTSRRTDEAEDGGWTEEVPEDGESEDGWRGWRMEGGIT
ncbi:hypothetical protein DFP72DRAFT_855758 [Ephemerocybe angulata]|uniref:Uncharacterized protein n=1 Tax=Ephemerocybe angulata TaxID=980116 RepID=A0A8H6LZD5_9AGAR|nr:hypothetical protein DFP72DRAFT_855758 [Tulosesus angulatus]